MWRTLLDHLGRIRPAWVLIGVMMLAATLRLWRLDILPPGLFFDEAYNGFDAREVLLSGQWPLFFPGNNGREPLFIYLQTLSVAVLGATPFALRIVAAAVGIAALPIVYFCAKALLIARPATPQQERAAGWLALVAATGLAISYWHLSLSRLGFRVNLLIPISALAIAFFWRAWTEGRTRDFAWSGLWLALAMYTYIAARLLPLVMVSFVVIQLLQSAWRSRRARAEFWSQWRPRLVGLCALTGVALLVVLPLAWTLLANPAWLSARSAQVSIWAAWQSGDLRQWLGGLAANALLALRAFYDQGDQNLRHNLPGRPANDLLLALLFTLGWLSALVTLVRKPRSMLVLLWFVIMLLPTVLSTEAPHYLRSAGALPPLAILYAFGAEAVITLGRRVRNRSAHTDPGAPSDVAAVLGVLLLLLLWSGTTTARDYFQRWARLPGLGTAFDVTKQLAAETAAQLLMEPASDEALLMASELYLQPQMGFALGPVAAGVAPSVLQQETAPIRMVVEDGFDQQASLMLVSLDGARPISTWLQPLGSEQLAATTPARTRRAQAHQPGWPQTTEVNLPPGAPLQMRQIRYPLDVTFANGLRLVGYDVEPGPGARPSDAVLAGRRLEPVEAKRAGGGVAQRFRCVCQP